MVQRLGHAPDDRQAEAQPRLLPARGARAAAEELVEDEVAFLGTDPAAGIGHLHPDAAGAPPRGQDDAARARVPDRVRHQILEDALQQDHVAGDGQVRAAHREPQALALRERFEALRQLRQQVGQEHRLQLRPDDAGIELGDVQERLDQVLDRLEPALHLAGDGAGLRRHVEVGQRRDRQAGGVHGLQQVVARRRQEAGLGPVRGLGLLLGGAQRRVGALQPMHQPGELLGPGADPAFQHDGGLEQRVGAAPLVHGPLDMGHQRGVDALELLDPPVQGRVGLEPAGMDGHEATGCRTSPGSATARLLPMAMPVKVWFRCIARYCSPKVSKPTTL